MKQMKRIAVMFFIVVGMLIIFAPTLSAHELYIEIDEVSEGEELRVDVLWGHIRDYVSEVNLDDYQLHVRYPSGDMEQLDLEAVGVHARAYVPIDEEGSYTFLATKNPGTHSPEEGVTQLSIRMAKVIHQVGDDTSAAEEPVEIDLQMVPDSGASIATIGEFSGTVLMNGEPEPDAAVTAYGPDGEVLEGTSDDNGAFGFTFDSEGKWLLKTNVIHDEPGELNDEAYEEVSHTSTLLLDIEQLDDNDISMWALAAALLAGLLIGASIPLFFLKRRSND